MKEFKRGEMYTDPRGDIIEITGVKSDTRYVTYRYVRSLTGIDYPLWFPRVSIYSCGLRLVPKIKRILYDT